MDQYTETMISLDENTKIAYLKAFTRLASADGKFDDNERLFIQNLAKLYELSDNCMSEVLASTSDNEVVEGVKVIKQRRVALELIKELCILAHSDDVLSDDETLLIGRIGQAMNVSLDKIEQISNWVIDKIILAEEAKIIFEEV